MKTVTTTEEACKYVGKTIGRKLGKEIGLALQQWADGASDEVLTNLIADTALRMRKLRDDALFMRLALDEQDILDQNE